MAVTRWLVEFNGRQWGADGTTIVPMELALWAREHTGEARSTYYRKPYVVNPADPQSIYDYFDSDIDPSGFRTSLVWEYVSDNPGWSIQS